MLTLQYICIRMSESRLGCNADTLRGTLETQEPPSSSWAAQQTANSTDHVNTIYSTSISFMLNLQPGVLFEVKASQLTPSLERRGLPILYNI